MLSAPSSSHSFRLTMRRVASVIACVLAGGGSPMLRAADRPLSGLVEREIMRRNTLVQEATAQVTEAGLLYGKGEYAQSAATYRQAWEMLPDSPMTAPL